jgi:hypothetical protein
MSTRGSCEEIRTSTSTGVPVTPTTAALHTHATSDADVALTGIEGAPEAEAEVEEEGEVVEVVEVVEVEEAMVVWYRPGPSGPKTPKE